jgi:hypothetical protein
MDKPPDPSDYFQDGETQEQDIASEQALSAAGSSGFHASRDNPLPALGCGFVRGLPT